MDGDTGMSAVVAGITDLAAKEFASRTVSGTPRRRRTFTDPVSPVRITARAYDDGMTDPALDSLDTEELRERAFAIARRRLDLSFFWDVVEHMPHSRNAETDGSPGSIGSVIDNIVETWQELHGHGYGTEEPLLRAKFIDYITAHGKQNGNA